jgi:hypothetical protein
MVKQLKIVRIMINHLEVIRVTIIQLELQYSNYQGCYQFKKYHRGYNQLN